MPKVTRGPFIRKNMLHVGRYSKTLTTKWKSYLTRRTINAQKINFSFKDFEEIGTETEIETADLVTLTEESLNGKLIFCAVNLFKNTINNSTLDSDYVRK